MQEFRTPIGNHTTFWLARCVTTQCLEPVECFFVFFFLTQKGKQYHCKIYWDCKTSWNHLLCWICNFSRLFKIYVESKYSKKLILDSNTEGFDIPLYASLRTIQLFPMTMKCSDWIDACCDPMYAWKKQKTIPLKLLCVDHNFLWHGRIVHLFDCSIKWEKNMLNSSQKENRYAMIISRFRLLFKI